MTVDLSKHSALVGAVSAVNEEFHGQLGGGMYTEELYTEFINKLKSVNVDDYIAVFQNEVNDFIN